MSTSRTLRLALLLLAAPAMASAQGKIELGKSLPDLEKAVAADPNDAVAHYNVALGYWNARRWPDVEKELKTALSLNPRLAIAHLTLAMLPYANRKTLWSEAISSGGIPMSEAANVAESDKHYRLAFFIDPLVSTSIIATVANVDNSTDFGRGVANCNEGRYEDCNAALAKYFSGRTTKDVSRIPKAVYFYNGLALAHMKDFPGAGATWGSLSNRKEDDTRTLAPADIARIPLSSNDMEMVIGTLQMMYNNGTQDAIASFQRALAADSTLYLAHTYQANIYDAQKNYERSIMEREAALKLNSEDPQLHYELGLTLAKAGKFADAAQHLTTATTMMPKNALAWYTLGQAKDAAGDKAGAKEAYGKAVANATAAQAGVANAAKAKMGA